MKKIKEEIIYKNEYSYSAWPSVVEAKNGDFLVAFSEAQRRYKVTHQDPTFHNVILRSSDKGKTWDKFPLVVPNYNFYGMDDPGLVSLRNGTLIMNTYQTLHLPAPLSEIPGYKEYKKHEPFPWAYHIGGTYLHFSYDFGYTWQETVKVNISPFKMGATLRGIVELEDNSLILGCYDESGPDLPFSFILRSKDGGKTWGEPIVIARDKEIGFYEPALLFLPEGKIIAHLRTHQPGDWHLYQTVSLDNGDSWSKPEKTPIWGHPAHLLLLKDRGILCTYGYRKPPYGIRACLSCDGGKTWDIKKEIIIRSDFPNGNLGYPTSLELEKNCIFTTYYGEDKDGVTCIWGTFWRI